VSGSYEWRKTDKVPFRISIETASSNPAQIFGLAGLWDAWKSPEGFWLQSYTIITTDPNEAMATIHDRMPVILDPREYDEWLTAPRPSGRRSTCSAPTRATPCASSRLTRK
jgi:putative SOS response-associated peptidase YedK